MEQKMKTALFCTMPIIKISVKIYYCKNFSELVAVFIGTALYSVSNQKPDHALCSYNVLTILVDY